MGNEHHVIKSLKNAQNVKYLKSYLQEILTSKRFKIGTK